MKRKRFFHWFIVSTVFYVVAMGVALFLTSGGGGKIIFQAVFYGIGMGLFQAWLMTHKRLAFRVKDIRAFLATCQSLLAQSGYELVGQKEKRMNLKKRNIPVLIYALRTTSQKKQLEVFLDGQIITLVGPKEILQRVERVCSLNKDFSILF